MYGILLISWYLISYILLSAFLQVFFQKSIQVRPKWSHIVIILCVLILMLVWVSIIPDPEWWNRFQHAFWWGFLIVLIFYLSTKNSGVILTKFQFLSLWMLLATMFWVVNEIIEYFMQAHLNMVFSTQLYDTWLDLIANTIWASFGVSIFASLLPKK